MNKQIFHKLESPVTKIIDSFVNVSSGCIEVISSPGVENYIVAHWKGRLASYGQNL